MNENVNEIMENLDAETANVILKKLGDAIVNEHLILEEQKKKNIEEAKAIADEVSEFEKSINNYNKDIEVQLGMVKSLEETIANTEDENVKNSLITIRDNAIATINTLRDCIGDIISKLEGTKDKMYKNKEEEIHILIASETLIRFGLKYGLISKVEKEEE